MVAINFTVFQDKIVSGEKCQTIRRTARCKPGDRLQLYTGMRTKACRKLGEAVCKAVLPVIIPAAPNRELLVGGRLLRGRRVDRAARADGFSSTEAFFAFFAHEGLPFEGVVIVWRDFQPAEDMQCPVR